MQCRREVQQVGGFVVDRHSGTVRRIDLIDDIPFAIAAELVLDPPGLRCNGGNRRRSLVAVPVFQQYLARAPHGPKSASPAVLSRNDLEFTSGAAGAGHRYRENL